MAKIDVTMTKEEVEEFLSGNLIARISTIGKDGYPMVYPMWFLYEDGLIVFTTPKYAVKLRNLRRNPRAAVAIDIAGDETKGVVFRGTAELVEEGARETAKRILLKYLGDDRDPMFKRLIDIPRTIIRFRPEKTLSWDYAKMR